LPRRAKIILPSFARAVNIVARKSWLRRQNHGAVEKPQG
jgi:hypothetical protein